MFDIRPLRHRIILTTVSSDSHTWNLVYLQLLLEEAGHHVHNLGACVPDDVLLSTVAAERPSAVIVSTVNGHGAMDGARVIRRLKEDPASAHIPVMIGGKLGVAEAGDAVAADLLLAGFDAVFTEVSDGAELTGYLAGLILEWGSPALSR